MPGVGSASAKAAVLQVNGAFYRAFSEGDAAAMLALWAKHAPLVCVHPGSPALLGREAVLDSWRSMLRRKPSFELRCDDPAVSLFGETAIVTCYEAAGDDAAHLAATNVFVLEEGMWRMVHHHAGPLSVPVPKPAADYSMN
jgi:ketosteroid isomerase-like protein